MLEHSQDSSALTPSEQLLIEQEHARMEQYLSDLGETCVWLDYPGHCHACDSSRIATCQGRLTSFFYDFLDLVAEHFDHEEAILSKRFTDADDDHLFHAHQAEHARLMHAARVLIEEAIVINRHGQPFAAISLLDREIWKMFGEHARQFDDTLSRM